MERPPDGDADWFVLLFRRVFIRKLIITYNAACKTITIYKVGPHLTFKFVS